MLSSVLPILLVVTAPPAPRADAFTIVIPVSPETAEGGRLIVQRAAEICGGKYPKLGRYRFSGTQQKATEAAGRFEVYMELACLDAPPEPTTVDPALSDWKPAASDEKMAAGMTDRYFALVDSGDVKGVHALWSRENQEMVTLPERQASLASFRESAGQALGHRIVKLTWYVNPAGAPGVYAAVDYERTYRRLVFNCGYLVWQRQPSGGFILIREETNFLSKKDAAGLSAEKVAEARALMRCPAA